MPTISYETIIWTIRYSLFATIMLTVLVIVSWVLIMNINVQDVESKVFINRVIYSENINYVDENGRLHPGVIDMNKFYQGNLEKEFIYPDERALAAKITLYEAGETSGKTIYYNKEWYNNWEPLRGLGGKGGISFVQRNVSVMIKYGEELKSGILGFKVIIPNT
jgi:hypothetical protein